MKTSGAKLGVSIARLRQSIAQDAIALTSDEDGIEFLNRKNPAG